MFGIKIISESRYLSEKKTAEKLVVINEELTQKNASLELDIKSLREQNTHLRAINGKRKDENVNLVEKLRKLKDANKSKPAADFKVVKAIKCDSCFMEGKQNCKKITVGSEEYCIIPEPSFRDKK